MLSRPTTASSLRAWILASLTGHGFSRTLRRAREDPCLRRCDSRSLRSRNGNLPSLGLILAALTQICTALAVIPVLSANRCRSSLLGNVFTLYASSKILSSSALVRRRFLCWSAAGVGAGVARGRLAGDMVVQREGGRGGVLDG